MTGRYRSFSQGCVWRWTSKPKVVGSMDHLFDATDGIEALIEIDWEDEQDR